MDFKPIPFSYLDIHRHDNKTEDLSTDEIERFKAEIELWSDYVTTFRVVEDTLCAIEPYAYTWGVLWSVNGSFYDTRFCFDILLNAQSFLREWDGQDLPTIGEDGCKAIKGRDLYMTAEKQKIILKNIRTQGTISDPRELQTLIDEINKRRVGWKLLLGSQREELNIIADSLIDFFNGRIKKLK